MEWKVGGYDLPLLSFIPEHAVGAVHRKRRPLVIDHFMDVVEMVAFRAFNVKFLSHFLLLAEVSPQLLLKT
jgi:hypothetical protein